MQLLDVTRLIDRLLSKFRRPSGALGAGILPAGSRVARLVAEPWYVDSVGILPAGDQVEIAGWALPDTGAPKGEWPARFLVNGASPDFVDYPKPRPDVQEFFWQRENAMHCGFTLRTKAAFPDGVMRITCRDSACTALDAGRQDWFIPDPALHKDLPDADRRFRVIGNREADGFLRLGATDAHRIKAAYESFTGKRWEDLGAILDWGVGCGRVARHLAPGLEDRFFGCDIDADNVAWCAAHLPGTYRSSKLEPPLPFNDNSFDAIYGVSVFTHLRASWEARWLAELHRVLRPGGTILMTVHGQTAIDFQQLDPVTYRDLLQRVESEGLAVVSANAQLDGFVEHPDEYVNVLHSMAHVRDVWGKWFANIRQLRGYIFTHDLVVATRK